VEQRSKQTKNKQKGDYSNIKLTMENVNQNTKIGFTKHKSRVHF
jgi:hypothetical protein